MENIDSIRSICPTPTVDLNNVDIPKSGTISECPNFCKKAFNRDSRCKKHYQQVAVGPLNVPTQCPFGFATYVTEFQSQRLALTAFVPHPRLGGEEEKERAKTQGIGKFDHKQIESFIEFIKNCDQRLHFIETETINKHSMALHEIRKLNRTVKHTAERLCRIESPNDPDLAQSELVTIWKTSELMSAQFDVIELLADESLATLPLKTRTQVYKIFDKCVRIFRSLPGSPIIKINGTQSNEPYIDACDKTFPIIPSVLIQNAMKYSVPSSPVLVDVSTYSGHVEVRVINHAKVNEQFDQRVFNKGVRASADGDGNGFGLYLAKLVVGQHKGKIELFKEWSNDGATKVTFLVRFPLA